MAPPATPAQLFARLEELGIATSTVEHEPVFTVEQARAARGEAQGTFIKNLFLRNKKKSMWLLVAREDRTIDLKALSRQIGAGHVSFATPVRLLEFLGVEPGAVTPFALINDDRHAIAVVLDSAILERDPIHCHPLDNSMTTAIDGQDLLRFIAACGHQPHIVDLD